MIPSMPSGPGHFLSSRFLTTSSTSCFENFGSDQVSHPHKKVGKIIVLYILILEFLDSQLEDKRVYAHLTTIIIRLNVFYSCAHTLTISVGQDLF